jgi:thiol-disulfide isomerase/thioredoxin
VVKRLVPVLVLVAAVGVALALTAGSENSTGGKPAAAPPVPEVSVPHLDGSGDFSFGQLASSRTPTLLWFWAPWCPVCNGEAPKIERLATDAGDELRVLAIGGRDEAANGPPFVEEHGLRTPTVLFDESMAAWEAYRIPGQPGSVLLDRDGRERARWLGVIDTDEVLAAARSL